MVTGLRDPIVAEARYRIDLIQQGMTEFNKIVLQEVKAVQNVHGDATKLYAAARSLLVALDEDYGILKEFINVNTDSLSKEVVSPDGTRVISGMNYYKYIMDDLNKRLGAMESLILYPDVPSSSQEPVVGSTGVSGQRAQPPDPSFTGVCTQVVDGDTIIVADRYVRMAGINAPEGGTDSGKVSTQRLSDLILGKYIDVRVDFNTPYDLYGRWLGVPHLHLDETVELGQGELLNVCVWMLRNCLAVPNLKFGTHHYVDPEENRRAVQSCVFGWPHVGQCKFVTNPTHCIIWVDGDFAGISGSPVEMSLGPHHVVLFKVGFSALHLDIEIERNVAQELGPFNLVSLPAENGLVEIHANPSNVPFICYINEVLAGVVPIVVELPLDTPVPIRLEYNGYESTFDTVIPSLDQVVSITVSPQPSPGRVVERVPSSAVPSATVSSRSRKRSSKMSQAVSTTS